MDVKHLRCYCIGLKNGLYIGKPSDDASQNSFAEGYSEAIDNILNFFNEAEKIQTVK